MQPAVRPAKMPLDFAVEKTISYSSFPELRERLAGLGPSRREPTIRPGSP
jgi:hypothetical protein